MSKIRTKKQSIAPLKLENLDSLDLDALPKCRVVHFRLNIMSNGLGDKISIPVMVMKGKTSGPIVGITVKR